MRSGQYAIADQDLIAFASSFAGLLFGLLSVGFFLAFWFTEQVGLLLIVVNAARGRRDPVSLVLWKNLVRLPALLRLGLIQAAAYLAVLVPGALGIGLAYSRLFGEWDFYYYFTVRPTSWWVFVAVAGAILTTYLALVTWLYVRWLFAIPAIVFENVRPVRALRMSWRRTRGRVWRLGLPLALCWIVVLSISFGMSWLIRAGAAQLLDPAQLALRHVVPTVLGTLALLAVVDLVWFIVAKTLHVMLMAGSYLETVEPESMSISSNEATPRISLRNFKRLGWLLGGIALVMGIGAAAAFVESLDIDRSIAVTAHRGSKHAAPENTLSAIRQAIADGADYAEIDVQTTADGVVVLLHDGDLRRVASVSRRLRDVDYDELGDIDVGSWFSPEFRDERVPTLQEVLDVARGRIKLNIELKFTWDDPALAAKVGQIVQENACFEDCVTTSLRLPVLSEIRAVAPELPAGFIVFQSIGDLTRIDADFLSISAARATPRLVRELHRRGRELHVWTVDDLDNALAMIELGVDNIITGYPVKVLRLLDEWNELSDSEKIALMLRNLIVGMERPEPGEL
jgi:glycerophosphoryl diester phosphodiesterase